MAVVQIRFGTSNAEWHRLMLDRELDDTTETVCEKKVPDTYRATREPNYEEPLCRDGCFAPSELRYAARLAAHRKEKRREAAEDFERESAAREVEREDSRRIQRERLTTGQHRPITEPEEDP